MWGHKLLSFAVFRYRFPILLYKFFYDFMYAYSRSIKDARRIIYGNILSIKEPH